MHATFFSYYLFLRYDQEAVSYTHLDVYKRQGLHQELVRNGYRTYPEIRVERVGE